MVKLRVRSDSSLKKIPLKLQDFSYKEDSDREVFMQHVESIRAQTIYCHPPENCTQECRDRGMYDIDKEMSSVEWKPPYSIVRVLTNQCSIGVNYHV